MGKTDFIRGQIVVTSDDPGWEHKKGLLSGEEASEAEQSAFSRMLEFCRFPSWCPCHVG